MATVLKVGVIGCGGIAQMTHLPFLAERHDLFQIEAVCDPYPLSRQAVAERYRVPHQFADAADLLKLPLDAVLVLSADPHTPAVIAAAQAGKHVFVEKPLAINLREVNDVRNAVDKAGVQLMIGYMKRFDPTYRHVQQLLAGRDDLRHAQINVWHPDDAAYRTHHRIVPPPVLLDRAAVVDEMGVTELVTQGVLSDLVDEALGRGGNIDRRIAYFILCTSIVHQVSAMRGILGEPEAVLSTHVWHDARGIQSTFQFSKQLTATLTWLFLPGIKHYRESYEFLAPDLRLEMVFPSPYLLHFPTSLRLEGMENGMPWEKHMTVSNAEAFHEEMLHFHHCVVTGERPMTGIEEAQRDTELLMAMANAYQP
ncbi:MAG: Gfo/Idh/MocA family oxidoreductase [Anaerolineales bacterium]|nr:Gfo/Idh/MocA family oxidoreductase [Anaerolineales bacterium]